MYGAQVDLLHLSSLSSSPPGQSLSPSHTHGLGMQIALVSLPQAKPFTEQLTVSGRFGVNW